MKTRFVLSTTIATLLSCAASRAATLTWNAGASSTWDTSATNWSGSAWTNTYDAVFGASGTGTVTIGAAVTANSLTFNNAGFTIAGGTLTLTGSAAITSNANASISSVLAGTAGLTIAGAGTLTLSSTSAYTGNTSITGGVLDLTGQIYNSGGSSAVVTVGTGATLRVYGLSTSGKAESLGTLGTGTANLVLNGGTLEYAGAAQSYGLRPFTVGAAGATLKASQTAGTWYKLDAITNNSSLALDGASTGDVQGLISGSGALIKNGGGTWVLEAANSYTGATTVNAGVLRLNSATATLGSGTTALTLANVAGAALLNSYWNGSAQLGSNFSVGSLAGGGSLGGNITLYPSTMTIGGDNTSTIYGGAIGNSGGSASIAKVGTGTLTLSGTSSYTGNTSVNGGVLDLTGQIYISGGGSAVVTVGTGGTLRTYGMNTSGHAESLGTLGTGAGNLVLNGGTLEYAGAAQTWGNRPFTVGAGGATLKASQSTGTWYKLDNETNNSSLTLDGASSGEFISGISGSGALIKNGSGTWSLDTANSYTGATTINAGVLRLNSATAALGSGTTALTLANVSGAALLNSYWNGSAQVGSNFSVGSLAGGGSLGGNITLYPSTMTIGTDNTSTTYGGAIGNSGGSASIIKVGSGSLTFTGANSYTGATTINNGTLQVGNGTSGSLASGSGVTIPVGGTLAVNLAGSGTFGSAIFISGGAVNAISTGTNIFSGNIGGYTYGTFNQNGTGTTILTGNNTFFGATNVNAGELQLNYLYGAFESTVNLNVSNGLAFGATSVTIGGLSGSGGFSLLTTSGTGVNLSVGNNNADTTYAGVIAGSNSASALTKVGTGTLTLTGSSTYVGPTTISAGTLQIGDGTTDGSIGSSSGIANSGALVCNVVTAQTIGGVISGTGTLTKNGNGLLTLTAASNSSGGVTTINSGTLQLGDGTSGHDGSLGGTIMNNSALVLNYSGVREFDGLISGTGAIVKTGAGTWYSWATASTFTGPVFINAGVIQLTYMTATLGSGSSAVTLANTAGAALNLNGAGWGATTVSIGSLAGGGANGGTVDMEGDTFIVGADNTSTTFAGVLQNVHGWGGISTFVKTGTGTLTLTGTNTYYGNTTVSGGVLTIGPTGVLQSQSGVVTVNNGGTLVLNGGWGGAGATGGFNTGGNFDISASKVVIDGGTIEMAGTYWNQGRSFTIGSNGATLQVDGGWALNNGLNWQANGGVIPAVPDNSSLTLTGSGTGYIAIPLSGTGALTKIGTGLWGLTGSNSFSGPVAVNAGTLQVGSANALLGGSTITFGGGTLQYSANNVDYSGVIVGSGSAISIDTNSQNVVFASSLAASNTGGLTKKGAGTLTLTASNSYAGATAINGGMLALGDPAAIPAGSTIGFGGGTLQYSSGNQADYSGQIVGSGSAISIDTNSQNVVFASALAASNTGGLTKLGSGTLTLSASNAYTGATTIRAGALSLGNANALAGGAITFGGGTLQYSGSNQADYSGQIVSSGSAISIDTNSQNVVFASALAASNTGGLTKLGAGTLTLTASNAYTGATTISVGTLQIGANGASGSIGATSGVSVGASGTLAFNRTDNYGGSFTPAISGLGQLLLSSGTLTLSGVSSYSGNTSIAGGVLDLTGQIYNSGGGAAVVTVGAGGTLRVYGMGTSGKADSLGTLGTGAGNLVLDGGTLEYSGAGQSWANRPFTVGAGGATLKASQSAGTWYKLDSETNNSSLTLDGASPAEFYNSISGSGALIKNGSGTWSLDAANSYTGATTINAGSLVLHGATAALGSGTTALTLANVAGAALLDSYWNGSAQVGSNFSVGSLAGGGSLGGNITLCPSTMTIGTDNTSTTYGGAIGNSFGSASIVKVGSGTLTFTGANTYAGATTINGGTLQLGDGTSGHDGSISNSSNIVNNGNLVYNLSGTVSYGGNISGTGSLTKSGAGTMQLQGWSTYSGPTTINSGILEFGYTEGLNGTSAVTLANVAGAALVNNFNNWGQEMVIGSLAGGGPLGGNVILNGHSLTVGSDNTSTTFAGVVAQGSWGNGSLVKVGTGTLTLAGSNTYVGNTTVSGGVLDLTGQIRSMFGVITVGSGATLRLHNWTGYGTSGWFNGNDSPADSTLVIDGGTIDMAATAGAFNNGRGFTIGVGGATLLVSQPGTSWEVSSSPVYWQTAFGPVTDNSNLTLSGAGDGQLDIPLIGTGSLTKSGGGTWTVTGSNSYSGATTVSAGTLKLGNANALGASDLTANGGTLDLNGNSVNVGALSGSSGTITSTAIGASTLATTISSGTSTFAGTIVDGPGAVALFKSGSGTLSLSGSSSYSGGTTINGGTLRVNADQALGASTGSVTINDGATLQTSGSFALNANRNVIVSGSVTIDTQVNTNTINGTVSGAGVLTKEGSGALILSGTVGIAGLNANNGSTQLAQSASIDAVSIVAGASITLAANTGGARNVLTVSSLTISGFSSTFAAATLHADGLAAGNDCALLGATAVADNGATPASPEAVPEPETWSLLLSGLGLLMNARRRKVNVTQASRL